ncbi:TTC30 [Mytilus coruscus]|uniref:TTC30 n=1 Tax=Mytilus coruscus TaxID=42192 RepID=A0A6J8ENM4_MYTCO|nr:TTC30 [Mytilus coruscus]
MSQFSVTYSRMFAPSTYEHSQHGPAATYTETYSHGFMKGKTFTLCEVDFCFGLMVDEWPAEADEWVTRQQSLPTASRIGVCINEAQEMAIEDEYKTNLKGAENEIVNAIDMDRISGYLYLETFYLSVDKLSMAIDTMTRILETNEGTSFIYPGECSMKEGIGMTSSKMLVQTDCPFLTGGIRLSVVLGFDIMFSPSNLIFVPYPVKYECALVQLYPEGCIMIHPVIYANFLLTFTLYEPECLQRSHAYLEKLEIVFRETKGGCQHFRALNLLGYCYLLIERFDLAYKCFEDSMNETVGHYRNAAIYHIIILIFDLIEMHVTVLKRHPIIDLNNDSSPSKGALSIANKLKLVTGTFMKETCESPLCKLCEDEDEDIGHLLLKCKILEFIRCPFINQPEETIFKDTSVSFYDLSTTVQTQLIMDCTKFRNQNTDLVLDKNTEQKCELISRNLFHAKHTIRARTINLQKKKLRIK